MTTRRSVTAALVGLAVLAPTARATERVVTLGPTADQVAAPPIDVAPSGDYAVAWIVFAYDGSETLRVARGRLPAGPDSVQAVEGVAARRFGVVTNRAGRTALAWSEGKVTRLTIAERGKRFPLAVKLAGGSLLDLELDSAGRVFLLVSRPGGLYVGSGARATRMRFARISSCGDDGRLASDQRGGVQILWRCSAELGTLPGHAFPAGAQTLDTRTWSPIRGGGPVQRLDAGTSESGPARGGPIREAIEHFSVKSDTAGDVHFAWDNTTSGTVRSTRRSAGTGRAEESTVLATASSAPAPVAAQAPVLLDRLDVSSNGIAGVLWSDRAPGAERYRLHAAIRPRGSAFSASAMLTDDYTPNDFGGTADLGISPSGHVLAAWHEQQDFQNPDQSSGPTGSYVATSSGDAFTPPRREPAAAIGSYPSVGADAHGNAITVFRSPGSLLRARIYTGL
jgi:hypothetical protein